MLTSRGLRVYTRPDGRIFPVDQTAKDVVAILQSYLDESNVHLYLNTPVTSIISEDGRIKGVQTGSAPESHKGFRPLERPQYGAKGLLSAVLADSHDADGLNNVFIDCPRVILAAGGSSYPNSGTTGDGWIWAKHLGHRVEKLTAALAPVYLELDPFDPARSGIALRDVVLRARQDGKDIAKWRNDLLFTHQGLSGPTVLGVSRVVAERLTAGPITLLVDMMPEQNHEQVTQLLLNESPKRLVSTFISEVIPVQLVADVMNDAGTDKETRFANFEKKARNRLVELLKGWPLGQVRTVPLEKGEVVAGGVSLDEVDPQKMKSILVDGLYLCGEVLDVAGPVGGYNLQAAFATGYVAGESAAADAKGA
jgi:predicted Rossmann fold flavoprotein